MKSAAKVPRYFQLRKRTLHKNTPFPSICSMHTSRTWRICPDGSLTVRVPALRPLCGSLVAAVWLFTIVTNKNPLQTQGLLLFRHCLVQLEEFRHAVALGHCPPVKTIRFHHGAVVVLMGAAQLRRHRHLVIEVGKAAIRV